VWLDFAIECRYINEIEFDELKNNYIEIGKMLYSMAANPARFTPKLNDRNINDKTE
jgi:hypothetical protein